MGRLRLLCMVAGENCAERCYFDTYVFLMAAHLHSYPEAAFPQLSFLRVLDFSELVAP